MNDKITKLIEGVLSVIPVGGDNPKAAYENTCPFCNRTEIIERDGKWFSMEEISHYADCTYLLAKEIKSIETNSRYKRKLTSKKHCSFMTVEDWNEAVKSGIFTDYDGQGYWVKDDFISDDEVFSTPALDATHVVWYNK